MRLTLTQFATLDGVYQGPGSPDEDPSDGFTRGGWMVPHMDQTFIDQAAAWLGRADVLLLGRRTYEAFAQAWPQITDPDDPFTERMNGLPKYVASYTLTDAHWSPSTILRGDGLGPGPHHPDDEMPTQPVTAGGPPPESWRAADCWLSLSSAWCLVPPDL